MTTSTTRAFRRLAIATSVAVYLLIIVGSIVRTTGSGLGCPDWPLCHGRLVPPLEITAIIEYTHRFVAMIGGLLMLAMFAFAWRRYRHQRWVVGPISTSVGLLVAQVPLGAIIVATELEPLAVAFHLGMAMLIFAGVLLSTVAAHQPTGDDALVPDAERRRRYLRLVYAALGVLFVLLLTGAVVVGTDAQLACPDWPLCHGGLLPPANASPLIAVHLLHRYTVVLTSVLVVLVIAATFRLAKGQPRLTRWAVVLGVLFTAQVIIGGVQVLLVIPILWRVLHLATASAVWGTLIVLAGLAALGHRASVKRRSLSPAMVTPADK